VIQLDRRQQLIVLLLVGVILFSGGYRLAQIKDKSTEKLKPSLESADENKAKNKKTRPSLLGWAWAPMGLFKYVWRSLVGRHSGCSRIILARHIMEYKYFK
jgi:hypothetical protein